MWMEAWRSELRPKPHQIMSANSFQQEADITRRDALVAEREDVSACAIETLWPASRLPGRARPTALPEPT